MREDKDEKELFSRLKIDYKRSKEDVWANMESLNGEKEVEKSGEAKVVAIAWAKLAIAASLILLVGVGLVARFYTRSVVIEAGQFVSHTLPDGSLVHLNADTKISYHPYWWKMSRSVNLDGEAYFEVAEGERFSVLSEEGITEVLGTEFNVYARDFEYEVFCESGKVSVSDRQSNSVILSTGEMVDKRKRVLQQKKKVNKEEAVGWRFNKFVYNTTPLRKVFSDLERHYAVEIQADEGMIMDLHYTGLFKRNVSAKEALEIICYSFDLTFENTGESVYVVRVNI